MKNHLASYESLQEENERLVREVASLKRELSVRSLNERLATLGQTAAALAHEIKNPLGSLKLFLSLLKQDFKGSAETLEILKQMEISVTTLDNVVLNILSFVKTKKYDQTPLNLHSIVLEQVEQFRRRLLAGSLTAELEGSPFLCGSEHLLCQAIGNLLLNALEATQFKGDVAVSITEKSDALSLVIKDNGPGIPPELEHSIFEPFFTTKGQGTGLGLALVRQIVESHGGTIQVTSTGGAAFSILLPRSGPKERV